MGTKRRKPDGSGFRGDGGSNVGDYMGLAERVLDSEQELEGDQRLVPVNIDLIDPSPYQTRVAFDSDELNALAEDIVANGLNQAVTVRSKPDGRYELVAGERRWRAAQVAGLETVDARIRALDDFTAHLIGVSENNQRANLSPWEKALEAQELQRHARGEGRPHAQRDLARYLNRNVSIVNQQLAIARSIPAAAPERENVAVRDLCQLPHEALHRIAKLPPSRRSTALADAIARRQGRNPRARDDTRRRAAHARPDDPVDRWTRLWEHGGLQLHIRKPLRELHPAKARSYIEQLLPGVGALAARAAQEKGQGPVARWEHEHGRLLFIRPPEQLSAEERDAARESLGRMITELGSSPNPPPPS
jgi:ParB/RepB/Spo0J family partition protein